MMQIKVALLLIALAAVYTEAMYIAVAGGYCMTYNSKKPLNTLIQLERCKPGDSSQSSWRIVPTGALYLVCIDDDICDHVAADGKKYLVKKNARDVSQQWTFKSDRTCTNELTGPKMCAELVYKLRIVPDHLAMRPCSASLNQKFVGLNSDKELIDHLKKKQ